MGGHGPPAARRLAERFSAFTGAPQRVGNLWPPRLMVHNVCTKDDAEQVEVTCTVWFRHVLVSALDVTLTATGPAEGPSDVPVDGLEIATVTQTVPSRLQGGAGWHPLEVRLTWDRAFSDRLQDVPWVRVPVLIELSDGETERGFQWHVYLTPHAAEIPHQSSQYDDHPHFRWVDGREGPLRLDGVARNWIELPAPMSSPNLPPSCWVQVREGEPGGGDPDAVELVPVFPLEPAIRPGVEAVGWNGALGGHDARPRVQALAVQAMQTAATWGAYLYYWDTPANGESCPVRQHRATLLEEPTDCVWPEVVSADARPLLLYDLVGRNTGGCDVKVNLRIRLPETAEAVRLERADIRLGAEAVGRWDGPALDLTAGQERSLPCTIDLHRLRDASDGRLRLTLVFDGRPTRGVVGGAHPFRTENGPFARLMRSRATSGGTLRTPWLAIDLGTEGTCASVAFLDGYVPRVINVTFDEGPIYPTRVHLAPSLDGTWELTDQPLEDALYTSLVKMGLRFGEGAHPGCPDHVSATEVARFFLKRFLLEVKERMAWFPLEDADVLVSFPPRLAAMPRFVSALRDTFRSVLSEVVWASGVPHRLRFREEAFLVAVPTLYRDLEVSPMAPNSSRYYWVMDFGGGTTDVCGFLCTADQFGEEHTVSHMTYPQRLSHHLAGNDVTGAFYALLHQELSDAGIVAGPDAELDPQEDEHRLFPLPPTPFPSARSTPAALQNQNALRELADALKCVPVEEQTLFTVREIARTLRHSVIRTIDGIRTTLVAVLAGAADHLGRRRVSDVHADVLEPGSPGPAPADTGGLGPRRATSDTTMVKCAECGEAHTLPMWAFASNRTFRFRCRACGHAQRVQLQENVLPDTADEGTPMILEYRSVRVQDRPTGGTGELYVEQDGRTFVVKDWQTLRRWIAERRVAENDLFSEGGISWQPLGERPELDGLFQEAEVLAVDTTQEIPPRESLVDDQERRPARSVERSSLGRDISLFLTACREALQRALDALPDGPASEVVVLVAGRASRFAPIARGVIDTMPGRVLHLTNEWVRRSYGNAGQIDPSADLKTMTVNGGGLFALLQSNVETSHLLLSFDTQIMDCPTYLQSASSTQPWLITEKLDLRSGRSTQLVREREEDPGFVEDLGTSAAEPLPRPLPVGTPLTGELQLVVEGLSEDRAWEPYVTIARGTARRHQGRRARTTEATELRTDRDRFVLDRLTNGREVEFLRMLPRLELLGGSQPDAE